jgi:hypothetical protein
VSCFCRRLADYRLIVLARPPRIPYTEPGRHRCCRESRKVYNQVAYKFCRDVEIVLACFVCTLYFCKQVAVLFQQFFVERASKLCKVARFWH